MLFINFIYFIIILFIKIILIYCLQQIELFIKNFR